MSDDLLREATRALREETSGPDEVAAFTRARVMASLHRGKRQRRWRVALFVPIAAVLAVSSALAARGPRASFWAVASAIGLRSTTEAVPAAPAPKLVARARARSAAVIAEKRRAEPARVEPAPAAIAPPPESPSAPHAELAPARRASPVAHDDDPELALYRSAHRLHFVARNPSAALGAWDAYLARAPRGRFAAEARYNRAICLARLGERAAAARALEPFANGGYGDYRRDDAQKLIDALGEGRP